MVEKQDVNVEQLNYLAMSFYNQGNKEQTARYATLFCECIDKIKQTYHRDYFRDFYANLSPSFLAREQDCVALQTLLDKIKAEGRNDYQFEKVLADDIQKMQRIM